MQPNDIKSFLQNAVIYEVNIRQYTHEGTFNAFAKHLPRLKDMGVNVLWLMPVQPIGVLHRKGSLGSYYSIADFTAINPEFGNENDFFDLVQEAHLLDIKVIIDWVANHTAWDHHWVKEQPDYYVYDNENNIVSPYDWSDVVQLNHANSQQQDSMVASMLYWVNEFNIDGFRCDMAHLTPLETWRKAKKVCDEKKPLLWMAETQETTYFEIFDIIYGWEWLHSMENVYKGIDHAGDLDRIIHHYNEDYKNGKYRILFTSNHDENSWQGSELKRLGDAAKTFAALCILLPGIPMIYSGQEEPIYKALDFFEKDPIGFEKFDFHSFYKDLLSRPIGIGNFFTFHKATYSRINTSHNEKFLAFIRKTEKNVLLVIANLTNENQIVRLYDDRIEGRFKEFMNELNIVDDFNTEFSIKAWEIKMYYQ